MKPKEFCDFFNISKDTLRFYRDSGLVTPVQNENGYYEYTLEDVVALAYCIKERTRYDTSIGSLSTHINSGEDAKDIETQLHEITDKIERINFEIKKLEEKKARLVYQKDYRNDLLKSVNTISEASFVPGLSYIKLNEKYDLQDVHRMLSTGFFFHGLGFDSSRLSDEYITPDHIIGLIDRYSLEYNVHFSNVKYIHSSLKAIRYTVEIDNLHKLDTHIFDSLKEYVREKNYALFPYVTSIILDVRRNPEKYIIMFRFLVK